MWQKYVLIGVVALLLVAMIVLPMFTNKKRQKAVQELHNSIGVGDKVKTVGGIVGTIVAVNEINALEKEFTLETGLEGSKSTMVFDFNAIYQVMAKANAPVLEDVEAPAETVEQPATEETKSDAE